MPDRSYAAGDRPLASANQLTTGRSARTESLRTTRRLADSEPKQFFPFYFVLVGRPRHAPGTFSSCAWHIWCKGGDPMPHRPRVIVALPDRVECGVLAEWLTADGYEPISRFTVLNADQEMHAHPFDVLVADARFVLCDGLRPGKALSNLGTPVVVLGNGEHPLENATSGHAMYLRRPVDRSTLICYISMAILEGRPTRCSVRKAVNRLDVLVNDMPVRLLDVSNEGLRVAMSARQREHAASAVKLLAACHECTLIAARCDP